VNVLKEVEIEGEIRRSEPNENIRPHDKGDPCGETNAPENFRTRSGCTVQQEVTTA
jgi:hypothetical protein